MFETVKDFQMEYPKYYWNQDYEIVNRATGKVLQGDRSLGYRNYSLYFENGKHRREHNVLLRATFPELFQPKDKQNYLDVFGLEDKYCFRKDNPNIIWSKVRRQFIKPVKDSTGHYFFEIIDKTKSWGRRNVYIHVMVWETYNQRKYDRKKYNVHHITYNSKQNNTYQNLMLIPKRIHHSFHNLLQIYLGKTRYAFGKKYTKQISYESFVKIINSYVGVSVKDKQRLIDSVNSLNLKISK